MHEAAFANAALPAAARVLGLALRPYSLGHELRLVRRNSAALPPLSDDPSSQISALPAAVMVCAHSWDEYNSLPTERFMRLKMWIWNARISTMDLDRELILFHQYVESGTRGFTTYTPDSDTTKSREFGTPLLLLLHNYVMSLPAVEWSQYGKSPWDYPFALALMRYTGSAELAGSINVENRHEAAHRIAAEKWEREHPESTLQIIKEQ